MSTETNGHVQFEPTTANDIEKESAVPPANHDQIQAHPEPTTTLVPPAPPSEAHTRSPTVAGTLDGALDGSQDSTESAGSQIEDVPPPLHTPHKKRILILLLGLVLATLDLCALPISYYYALRFGTKLSLQDIFAVITGVYGLLSFTHYSFRTFRLFFESRGANKFRPLGWTRWGCAEFLQVNLAIIIAIVEIELVAGTAPSNPILRLCAMPSASICYWLGILFLTTAFLTQYKYRLPFNLSSTPKGEIWRPALFPIIEDSGCIEARGEQRFRRQCMRRYEASPLFRRMLLRLTWAHGAGFMIIAIVSTVLIMVLPVNIAFGVGWGLPFLWTGVNILITMAYVRRSLQEERRQWRAKAQTIPRTSIAMDRIVGEDAVVV